MEQGYSTATAKVREMGFGAGMGFSNMKANTDSLIVDSYPNKGTKVQMINNF